VSGRDHSITCDTCGFQRGGLNDYKCDCDVVDEYQRDCAACECRWCHRELIEHKYGHSTKIFGTWCGDTEYGHESLCCACFDNSMGANDWQGSLGRNLAIAAALCRAWEMGPYTFCYEHSCPPDWQPGCGREPP
jgi:hypothetical protein